MNEGEVYFRLFGAAFDPDEITQRLDLVPSRTRRMGTGRHKYSAWDLSSGKVSGDVVDVYELSRSLVRQLAPKATHIREIANELQLTTVLQVVLWISMDNETSTPAIGFDQETVEFLSAVKASIDIDTYKG